MHLLAFLQNQVVCSAFDAATLLAQGKPTEAPAGGGGGGVFGQYGIVVPMALMGLVFYFLMWRPESQRRAKMQELLAGLKKNDRVHTNSGIYGVVVNVQTKYVTLRVDENNNTKIKVLRTAVAGVVGDEDEADESGEPAGKEKNK